MNNFSTSSFDFYIYNISNNKNNEIINRLNGDTTIRKYFLNVKYFLGNSFYLVMKDNAYVGFLHIHDYYRTMELSWALLKDYQAVKINSEETIGSRLVKEASNEILNSNSEVINLRALIAQNNIKSAKVAEKAGFIKINDYLYRKSHENKPNITHFATDNFEYTTYDKNNNIHQEYLKITIASNNKLVNYLKNTSFVLNHVYDDDSVEYRSYRGMR